MDNILTTTDRNVCRGCGSEIQSQQFMNCLGCRQSYDLQCANLSPKRYKALNQENKRKWRCDECRTKEPKTDNKNTPVRTQYLKPVSKADSEQDCSSDSSNVTSRKRPELKKNYVTEEKMVEIMKSERQAMKATVESSAKVLSEQLKSINEQFTGSQESLSYVSKQYEDLKKEITELKKMLSADAAEMKSLREENKTLKENFTACLVRVKRLEEDSLKQQQWVRMQNLELVGIPEDKDEVTINTVVKIAEHIGVNIHPSDIEFAHRVQPRRAASAARARSIVVHLKQRGIKDRVLAAARKHRTLTAKDVGMGSQSDRIFVNEHLTRENKMLLNSCKQKAKEVNYKYIWTKNCRIYVRKSDASPPIPIASIADLVKIA